MDIRLLFGWTLTLNTRQGYLSRIVPKHRGNAVEFHSLYHVHPGKRPRVSLPWLGRAR